MLVKNSNAPPFLGLAILSPVPSLCLLPPQPSPASSCTKKTSRTSGPSQLLRCLCCCLSPPPEHVAHHSPAEFRLSFAQPELKAIWGMFCGYVTWQQVSEAQLIKSRIKVLLDPLQSRRKAPTAVAYFSSAFCSPFMVRSTTVIWNSWSEQGDVYDVVIG